MRAKLDLVPDCDVHGDPMYRDELPAAELGLKGSRDVIVWRCGCAGCRRYFESAVGYRDVVSYGVKADPKPRCPNEGAFLVAQQALGAYICPVAGCATVREWDGAGSHDLQFAGKVSA